mmetsp:Transcript_67220/g.218899  ORF Transcript_67220/g.218899 Transcript_67220/m.218899 type:complete len:136 (-) Transcript_67220:651-1058(-)
MYPVPKAPVALAILALMAPLREPPVASRQQRAPSPMEMGAPVLRSQIWKSEAWPTHWVEEKVLASQPQRSWELGEWARHLPRQRCRLIPRLGRNPRPECPLRIKRRWTRDCCYVRAVIKLRLACWLLFSLGSKHR